MMYFTSFNLFAFAHYTLSILSSNFFCFKLSKIVFIVAEVPVLVHGTEGTDSTLLVTSLTTLALDSDVRTIRGFQSLIEREWIAAGHPFWLRCNHGAFAVGGVTGPDESPTFLLFLDCVWQVYSSDIWMSIMFRCVDNIDARSSLPKNFSSFYSNTHTHRNLGHFLAIADVTRLNLALNETPFRYGMCVYRWVLCNRLYFRSFVNNPNVLQQFVNDLIWTERRSIWPSIRTAKHRIATD